MSTAELMQDGDPGLPYFRAWQCDVPANAHPDTASAWRYNFSGVRDLALAGNQFVVVVARDDSFGEMTMAFAITSDVDSIVGALTLRSTWGTIYVYSLRSEGEKQVLVASKILRPR